MESGQGAGGFFIWEEAGEGQSGMVIDGDVEGLDACARVAMGAVAGGADSGLMKAAKLFNIKVKQLTWGGPFITLDGRLGRIESGQAIEAVTLEDTGEGSF